jgi:hypothetical protein
MPKFIEFHVLSSGNPISINVDLLERVSPRVDGPGANIVSNCGPMEVRESYEEVLRLVAGDFRHSIPKEKIK